MYNPGKYVKRSWETACKVLRIEWRKAESLPCIGYLVWVLDLVRNHYDLFS